MAISRKRCRQHQNRRTRTASTGGSPTCHLIGAIDDDDLKRLYSYYHFGGTEIAEHLSICDVGTGEYQPPEEDVRRIKQASFAIDAIRTTFYYGLRRRRPKLLDVQDSNIWTVQGWQVIALDLTK